MYNSVSLYCNHIVVTKINLRQVPVAALKLLTVSG